MKNEIKFRLKNITNEMKELGSEVGPEILNTLQNQVNKIDTEVILEETSKWQEKLAQMPEKTKEKVKNKFEEINSLLDEEVNKQRAMEKQEIIESLKPLAEELLERDYDLILIDKTKIDHFNCEINSNCCSTVTDEELLDGALTLMSEVLEQEELETTKDEKEFFEENFDRYSNNQYPDVDSIIDQETLKNLLRTEMEKSPELTEERLSELETTKSELLDFLFNLLEFNENMDYQEIKSKFNSNLKLLLNTGCVSSIGKGKKYTTEKNDAFKVCNTQREAIEYIISKYQTSGTIVFQILVLQNVSNLTKLGYGHLIKNIPLEKDQPLKIYIDENQNLFPVVSLCSQE